MNKAVLVGRLVRDPDLKFAAGSGNAVSKFTVAVNRQFKKDETDFISCVAFGKTAETIAQYFTKGKQIAVSGSIRTGSYETQDGTKRYTTEVIASKVQFLSKSNGASQNYNSDTGFDDGMTPVDDGDMPF